MLPLRDNIPSRRFPGVTLALIVVNVLVFYQELKMGSHVEEFMLNWGIVPARYTSLEKLFSLTEKLLPVFSSMFLHGGWLHLIGNMWVLWIFGDNIEDHLGHVVYPIFYLVCGVLAAVTQIYASPGSEIPSVGASGAIAGILGAYLLRYPQSKV